MIKIVFAILSVVASISCFIPYIRDIRKGVTKPHMYSWLIWTILQFTSAIIIFSKGGELGALSISVGAILCGYIFILSFKNGTRNINLFDKICFLGSLFAISIWLLLDNALISVILLSVIDFVGFLPTIRKSYFDPNSETALTYVLSVFSGAFAIIALSEYSYTTLIYLISIVITNTLCTTVIVVRRNIIHDSTISRI